MRNTYWYGKNVFVTGINGFIAGNLAKLLIRNGANVFGLIRNHNEKSFISFEDLSKHTVKIYGDILDKDLLCRIISEENISVVFHLAAQVEIGVGIQSPFLTFETNIRGTYNLLEAIRINDNLVESAVFASTDKAYGSYPTNKMPYKEDYPLIPKYPYDTSKACADMLTQSYTNEIYQLPIAITRFSNIYGPGQLNFSALIPSAISAALGFNNFTPRSDGSMIRDFLYVEDVAELYLIIAQQISLNRESISGEVFNAGTNRPTSVRDVLQKIFFLADNEKIYSQVMNLMKKKQTKGEISCQYMDFEKLLELFNWRPKTFMDEGLLKTIEWYKSWYNTNERERL